jgi:death-on-curing protein
LTPPVFLTLDEVIAIHNDQIKRYGGLPGIRDIELLKSAVAMPAVGFAGEFLHSDIFEMAAAYLYHIIQNHPFIDGNKRAGTVASIVFLLMNNIEVDIDENDLELLVLSVANGESGKTEITQFFRNNIDTEE